MSEQDPSQLEKAAVEDAKNWPVVSGVSTVIITEGKVIFVSGDNAEIVRDYIIRHHGQKAMKDPIRMTNMILGPQVTIDPFPAYHAFAKKISGRQIGNEITPQECQEADELELVVMFGASDDLTEIRGAIYDEVGLGEIRITTKGKLLNQESFDALEKLKDDGHALDVEVKVIEAEFTDEGRHIYKTDIPHAKFDVMDGEEPFCTGIVFSLKDLPLI